MLYNNLLHLDIPQGSLQGGGHVRIVHLDNNETGSHKRRFEQQLLLILILLIVIEFVFQIQVLQAFSAFQILGYFQQESQEFRRCGSFGA